MKTLINCIRMCFTAIVAFMLPLLGVFAALVSAIIEYSVLHDFLQIPIEGINQTAFAISIVLALEGIKFISYFFSAGLNRKNLQVRSIDPEAFKQFLNIIRKTLVSISIFCSVVFFINQFYYNVDSSVQHDINAQSEEAKELLDKEKEDYRDALSKEKGLTIKEELLESEKDNLEKLNDNFIAIPEINNGNQYSMDVALQNTKNAIEESQIRIDTLENQIELLSAEVNECVELYFSERVRSLEKIEVTDEQKASGDNPVLRIFLSAIYKTFTGKMYGRKTYLFISCLIGILLSLLLEAIISASLSILNLDTDEISSIVGNFDDINRASKHVLEYCIRIITATMLSMSVFLVISLFVNVPITKDSLMIIILTYCITGILWNRVSIGTTAIGNTSLASRGITKANDFFSKAYTVCMEWLAPNAISFVVFIVLGYFLKTTFEFDSIESLAVAIGGSFARVKNINYTL